MKSLDMKDIAIIDAFPVHDCKKIILNVGCGEARIDYHLANMGYQVYAIDIKKHKSWLLRSNLTFHQSDIFDLSGFPISSAPIVICSQILEHLKDYRKALANLLKLTEIRLILTFPFKRSFYDPSHVNFWNDDNVQEFKELCKPYFVSISKIRTKPIDIGTNKYDYLIIIDKRQKKEI